MSERTGLDRDQQEQQDQHGTPAAASGEDVRRDLGGEGDDVLSAAASEQRAVPGTAVEAADLAETYEAMMRLADLFDDAGEQMRERAKLGRDLLGDPSFTDAQPLAPASHAQAEEDVRAATSGKSGLLSRSLELDADALVLRATVLTYRWIDELQSAAYRTLGSIAGRAIGYLAPEVALGGAIVSAGLIETDALDRDGVAAYLSELAEANPELMEHVTTGGGGLLDSLRMRSLLTAGLPADAAEGAAAARGGLRAVGAPELPERADAALRDVGGSLVEPVSAEEQRAVAEDDGDPPRTLADLVRTLEAAAPPLEVRRAAPGRFVAYLPGRSSAGGRLVDGDPHTGREHLVAQLEQALDGQVTDPGDSAHVMLVGAGQGGVAAAELAAAGSGSFVVDQVVTAGSPSAHVPRIPEGVRVLSLEDSADPVALLGSLMSAGTPNRVTVVFDGGRAADDSVYVTGARAADQAPHPELRAELQRLRELGYLAPPA